ncbi:enhancer of filamentation 1 isoform X1 [Brienomyrus brachyistius]|uniref:enhancer of filamentation 1 isoform X1 n=1 Tax=Brienomyrus brachyistius TaxID=42636 RepID=UPI0020B2616F|nr:enhancer of filamentation 1 isoform X1 [Brienomyrus brachyistius]
MKYEGLMARALYDNVPESPEELAFRKGDILTVLEQNTGGVEGWWLCSLHGRQGIAPGNRLKLLVGPTLGMAHSDPASQPKGPGRQEGLYQVPLGQDVYQVPQSGGRAVEGLPGKVVTPQRIGQSYAYQPSPQVQRDFYDVPPVRAQGVYDTPPGKQLGPTYPGQHRDPQPQGLYDIPPTMQGQVYSIPPCKNNPIAQEGSYDFPQPHKQKHEDIYDVPPPTGAQPFASNYPDLTPKSSSNSVYDIPPMHQQFASSQKDVYDIPRGAPPSHSWDVTDGLQCLSLSSRGPSHSAPQGRVDNQLVKEGHSLNTVNHAHAPNLDLDSTRPFPVSLALEQEKDGLGATQEHCVKSWMEDYDYVHLQGKEEFEQQQQALLQKENIMKQGRLQLEKEQLKQFKKLEQEVIKPVEVTKPAENDTGQQAASHNSVADPASMVGGAPICGRDRQLLRFYSEQCGTHFDTLLSAVDAFFACVREGQPPRVFVAHSKLVILSAHKLVFIGDTLSRQAATPEVAQRALDGSNALCQMLKAVVGATKMAALRYPNTAPLQEMVDRVAVLSHLAQQFQAQLLRMAES